MESTKSFIRVYNVTPNTAEDFEFDYDALGVSEGSSDILTELVPNLDQWGDIGWMEAEEYEYDSRNNRMSLILDTKWDAPVRWLQQASHNCPYFENKLITMTTIQKDETCVTGVVVMDGEVLQNKHIFQMEPEEVAKHYEEEEEGYNLDKLDNEIWDSIGKFLTVCEQFYTGKEEESHD
jgi:hypothetical protein